MQIRPETTGSAVSIHNNCSMQHGVKCATLISKRGPKMTHCKRPARTPIKDQDYKQDSASLAR